MWISFVSSGSDMNTEFVGQVGLMFGCGMGMIKLGGHKRLLCCTGCMWVVVQLWHFGVTSWLDQARPEHRMWHPS